jgi:starch phosphorylase
MSNDKTATGPNTRSVAEIDKLIEQYECGPVQLAGTGDALYERHLMFDNVADAGAVGPRERYEAVARSVRDILSQRWLRTDQTYERANPKRIYYLSMEFLIGRSLANNIMNLLLDPAARQFARHEGLDWLAVLEREPDAGLGNGGLGRLAACFLDSMATMQLPAMGYGLRYEYGIFKQAIRDGWQYQQPDNWLRRSDPWEVPRPHERVEIKLGCSFEVRGGTLAVVQDRPSSLYGFPYDRPVVGYGGKTINTLRLWSAGAHDVFDFQMFSHGEFVSALAERLAAESLTRVLYPDDSTSMGQALRFIQEYFLVACSLSDLIRRFHRSNADWSACRKGGHPAQRHSSQPRRCGVDRSCWTRRSSDGTRPGISPDKRSPIPTTHSCPRRWRNGPGVVPDDAAAPSGDHYRDQPPPSRRVRRRFPGDAGRVERVSLVEEAGNARSGWRSRHRRLAQHHGVAAIHRPAAPGDGQGSRRDLPRALQQQDQWGDAAALAAARQSGARCSISGRRQGWIRTWPSWRSSGRSPMTQAFAMRFATPSATPSSGLRNGSARRPASP